MSPQLVLATVIAIAGRRTFARLALAAAVVGVVAIGNDGVSAAFAGLQQAVHDHLPRSVQVNMAEKRLVQSRQSVAQLRIQQQAFVQHIEKVQARAAERQHDVDTLRKGLSDVQILIDLGRPVTLDGRTLGTADLVKQRDSLKASLSLAERGLAESVEAVTAAQRDAGASAKDVAAAEAEVASGESRLRTLVAESALLDKRVELMEKRLEVRHAVQGDAAGGLGALVRQNERNKTFLAVGAERLGDGEVDVVDLGALERAAALHASK